MAMRTIASVEAGPSVARPRGSTIPGGNVTLVEALEIHDQRVAPRHSTLPRRPTRSAPETKAYIGLMSWK